MDIIVQPLEVRLNGNALFSAGERRFLYRGREMRRYGDGEPIPRELWTRENGFPESAGTASPFVNPALHMPWRGQDVQRYVLHLLDIHREMRALNDILLFAGDQNDRSALACIADAQRVICDHEQYFSGHAAWEAILNFGTARPQDLLAAFKERKEQGQGWYVYENPLLLCESPTIAQ